MAARNPGRIRALSLGRENAGRIDPGQPTRAIWLSVGEGARHLTRVFPRQEFLDSTGRGGNPRLALSLSRARAWERGGGDGDGCPPATGASPLSSASPQGSSPLHLEDLLRIHSSSSKFCSALNLFCLPAMAPTVVRRPILSLHLFIVLTFPFYSLPSHH